MIYANTSLYVILKVKNRKEGDVVCHWSKEGKTAKDEKQPQQQKKQTNKKFLQIDFSHIKLLFWPIAEIICVHETTKKKNQTTSLWWVLISLSLSISIILNCYNWCSWVQFIGFKINSLHSFFLAKVLTN